MFGQLALGSAIIALTFLIQAGLVTLSLGGLERVARWVLRRNSLFRLLLALTGALLWMVFALTIAVWIWAAVYRWLGAFADFETALYFSVVSFTTLGFGDIVPSRDWRLLPGLEAANGLIMFALSTAFLIEIVERMRAIENDL